MECAHTQVSEHDPILDTRPSPRSCAREKSSGVEIEHDPCSEEIHDITFNLRPMEDDPSEEEHYSSSLERVLHDDQETQGFTSPTIHNPSGRQEDVDLMQSLQIREARILNLTRKRDMLLNLAGFKLK